MQNRIPKKRCKDNGGEWEDGVCDFKTDDEDKADKFLDDVQKIEEFEEEKAALENAYVMTPKIQKSLMYVSHDVIIYLSYFLYFLQNSFVTNVKKLNYLL